MLSIVVGHTISLQQGQGVAVVMDVRQSGDQKESEEVQVPAGA